MSKNIASPVLNFLQEREISSLAILRFLGYGLTAMALLDFVSLLIPPQLMNPTWEFETVGSIVERMPVILLGIAFVFWGERCDRAPIETHLLRWLSWFCLILAIFLLLAFPLNIVNVFRIYNNNNARVNLQTEAQIEALSQLQNELKTVNSLEQITSVLQKQSNSQITIPESIDIKELKANIINSLIENQKQLKQRAVNLRSNKSSTLIKYSLRWNLGSLISAFILLFMWRHTLWARLQYELETD